jgi:hypothetical protein
MPAQEVWAQGNSGQIISEQDARRIWEQALAELGDLTAEMAGAYDDLALPTPHQLVVNFTVEYTHHKEACERPERRQRLEQAVSRLAGRTMRIDFQVAPNQTVQPHCLVPVTSPLQRMREIQRHPLVQRAIEIFDAEVVEVRPGKARSEVEIHRDVR